MCKHVIVSQISSNFSLAIFFITKKKQLVLTDDVVKPSGNDYWSRVAHKCWPLQVSSSTGCIACNLALTNSTRGFPRASCALKLKPWNCQVRMLFFPLSPSTYELDSYLHVTAGWMRRKKKLFPLLIKRVSTLAIMFWSIDQKKRKKTS